MHPPAKPHIPGFEIRGLLGRGGMGCVYEAGSADHGRVALKVLETAFDDGTFRRRFAHEADLAATVKSPHVATLLKADATADPPWLAIEYVDGPTLQEKVERDGPLSSTETLRIIRDVAHALLDIHAAGIVHRDLKPSNILCGSDGVARVTDFGIAATSTTTQLTRAGERIGTLSYTAPEVLGGSVATPARDVFALGAVAFLARTGRSLFGGGTDGEVIGRILSGTYSSAQVGDADVDELISACLRKDPKRRPMPAGVVTFCERKLEAAPTEPTTSPEAGATLVRAIESPPKRRRVPLIGLIAAAIIVATTGIALMWWRSQASLPVATVQAAALPFPHGDQVRIDWSVPSDDRYPDVRLVVDEGSAPDSCPSKVMGSGTCTFSGRHDVTYRIGLVSDTDEPAALTEPATATTYPEPRLTVRSGESARDASGTVGCPVVVDAQGLLPDHLYKLSWQTDAWDTQGRAPQPATLDRATDSRGNVTGAGLREVVDGEATELGYEETTGWVRVQIDGLEAAVQNPWGCS